MKKQSVAFLRKVFESYLEKRLDGHDSVNLLLSSGMDSTVAGFAAHSLGLKVKAYTFQLGDNWSFDSKYACRTADAMGWEWELVQVPDNLETAKKALRHLAKKYHCIKKRDFEVSYPALYAYRQVSRTGISPIVLNGLIADGYFVYSRRSNIEGIAGKNSDFKRYVQFRKDYFTPLYEGGHESLSNEYNPSAMYQHKLMCDTFGLTMLCPYEDPRMGKFFFPYSWNELNSPRQKHHLASMYPEWTEKCGHRNHRSYQTTAGIPEFMAQLVDDPVWNEGNYKSVTGIYNALVRGEICE